MKHIEQIQPEYAADDMTALLLTDATASAALSRLLHDWTGCAIPPTADTPQSEVEELVPLCLSILRRHWTTPLTALGDGNTPMSLADLLRRLIGDRVQGNEALGIPPANANIPTAVAALLDRKIGGVNAEIPDGVSMGRLLCDGTMAAMVTEIIDDRIAPWTYTNPLTEFSQVKKVLLRFNAVSISVALLSNLAKLEELYLPEWTNGVPSKRGAIISNNPLLREVHIDKWTGPGSWYDSYLFYNDPALEILDIPSFGNIRESNCRMCFRGLTALHTCKLGKLTQWAWRGESAFEGFFADSLDLIHLEIGAETAISFNIFGWSPTNALDASRTDLIEEGSTAQNNLQQFLANFRKYIAQRLTDKGSGLTLTLSQAVRDAIQQDPDIVNIITSKGWTISPAPSV